MFDRFETMLGAILVVSSNPVYRISLKAQLSAAFASVTQADTLAAARKSLAVSWCAESNDRTSEQAPSARLSTINTRSGRALASDFRAAASVSACVTDAKAADSWAL
ncbi:MAG: hypothetical protein AAFR45_00365, partial [Pseudomonadota bacterium]